MPLTACLTSALLSCYPVHTVRTVRVPLRPHVQPVRQAAALPDIRWLADVNSPAASQPAFRLSPDEIVARSFHQVHVYSLPAAAPDSLANVPQPADPGAPGTAPEPVFRLSADEIVAMRFQQIVIYSPAPADPERLGKRKREKAAKPQRQSRRRTGSAGTEVVTTKVTTPVLAYATAEPAGRRSLLAGMFRTGSATDDGPGFALSASGYTAVKYEARIQKVPEKLALSIARIESNGACGAQSSANAIGVMQIKHATAQMIGYSGSAAGLKNCKTSAKWGVKYLAMCLDLADDDVKKAALCYNQGHGTLSNKRKYGRRVERPEAKGYVAKMKALGWRL